MKRLLTISLLFLIPILLFGQEQEISWLMNPAISPDGNHILFGYKGNIYQVDAQGGLATPLTTGEGFFSHPIWSHDGKKIAFSNDRYGNFDVYVMSATGGEMTRLTYHSADDYAYDFTPNDDQVLIGSRRNAPAESIRFPGIRYFQNLYTVPVEGGRLKLILAAGVDNVQFSRDGSKLVFQDVKGYEDYYRKHERAALTRDVWIYDFEKEEYEQISHGKIDYRVPHFNAEETALFYTNEASGDLNVVKYDLKDQSETALTHFTSFPVRSLSVSKKNKMAFSWKGEIYTLTEGERPKKLSIHIRNSAGFNTLEHRKINSVSEFNVSPNGKEIAFINRGEVFVTGVDNKQTKRITNTPEQERMVTWTPDSKTLIYSGEFDGSWNIYKTTLEDTTEKFFFGATNLKTEPLISTGAEEYQPKVSPDGKKIAYVEQRNILKVMDLKTEEKVTILPEGQNYSYSDGDWDFEWSPDSRWLLVDDDKGYFSRTNTALISADGKGDIVFPVNSGFGEENAKWGMEGKMMTYKTTKHGRKSLAYQGSHEEDIYAVFFDQKAYDEYTMNEDEFKLLEARKGKDEEKDKKKKEDQKTDEKKDDSDKKKDKEKKEPLKLNLDNLENRRVRLTINSATISDYILTKKGDKLYYLASFEKGYNLWQTEPRTRKTKILAHLTGTPSKLELSEDEKTLFLRKGGSLVKIDAASGKETAIPVSTEMVVNPVAERKYIFDHIWRQMKEKLFDPQLQEVDWKMYYDEYVKFLPFINNNYDFQILLSELLGEMNVSHTGGRYYPTSSNTENTASLGLLYDETYDGPGVKITEVLKGGPLDKADSKVRKGDLIVKIGQNEISTGVNWYPFLNNISGKNTRLTFKRGDDTFDETIIPVSLGKEQDLMYKRWISKLEKLTDSLSDGKVGYVHIQGMNDGSFREVYERVMGKNADKKALVVDTRFNGGGWLHNDLNTFLSGRHYLSFLPQGHLTKGGEPVDRWTKPSIVLMSEGNYSDAFIFPYIYKQNGIGKLVGMPVAGTGTAVWWERQIDPTIVFGIPMVATTGTDGKITENVELEPDILVQLPFKKFLSGEDTQLDKAVEEVLKEVK